MVYTFGLFLIFSQSPSKPQPYTRHKSPSPTRDSTIPLQAPPPVPTKKRGSQYMKVNPHLNAGDRARGSPVKESTDAGPGQLPSKPCVESLTEIYVNRPQPVPSLRNRSSTVAGGISQYSCMLQQQPVNVGYHSNQSVLVTIATSHYCVTPVRQYY